MLQRRRLMNSDIAAPRIGAGAAAGLVGTALVQGLMAASQKWAPQSLPPIKQDPGEFMVKKLRSNYPTKCVSKFPSNWKKPQLNRSHLATARPSAPYTPHPVRRPRACYSKAAPCLAAWGVGYLGWLPATGLMPAV